MLKRVESEIAAVIAVLLVGGSLACAPDVPLSDEEKLTRIGEMTTAIEGQFSSVRTVTVEEVGRLLEKDSIVLVDVREAREREVSVIPGSITAEVFEANPEAYTGVAVVAYCTIGHRSSVYAARLTEEGHPVLNLTGSILAWAHAGAPLIGPEGPTRALHVYGSDWDLAPERYETTW